MNLISNPKFQLIAALFALTLIFTYVLKRLHRHFDRRVGAETGDGSEQKLGRELLGVAVGPGCLLIWYYGLYGIARVSASSGWISSDWSWLQEMLRQVSGIGVFIALFWFFY